MKLKGVYLAVRILLRLYVCSGRPSSSRAESGNGLLKYMVRAGADGDDAAPSSSMFPVSFSPYVPAELRFSAFSLLAACRANIDRRLTEAARPVTLLVAHRNRFAGLEVSMSPGSVMVIAIVDVSCGTRPSRACRPVLGWSLENNERHQRMCAADGNG